MRARQAADAEGVVGGYVEWCKSLADQTFMKVRGYSQRSRQLADPHFGGNFPSGCGANENAVLGYFDPTAVSDSCSSPSSHHSKVCVSSKAFNYCSQTVSSSSGSGSKKASVTVALPRIAPNCRWCGVEATGTSLTTGFFPLAMITSSPAHACSMS